MARDVVAEIRRAVRRKFRAEDKTCECGTLPRGQNPKAPKGPLPIMNVIKEGN